MRFDDNVIAHVELPRSDVHSLYQSLVKFYLCSSGDAPDQFMRCIEGALSEKPAPQTLSFSLTEREAVFLYRAVTYTARDGNCADTRRDTETLLILFTDALKQNPESDNLRLYALAVSVAFCGYAPGQTGFAKEALDCIRCLPNPLVQKIDMLHDLYELLDAVYADPVLQQSILDWEPGQNLGHVVSMLREVFAGVDASKMGANRLSGLLKLGKDFKKTQGVASTLSAGERAAFMEQIGLAYAVLQKGEALCP